MLNPDQSQAELDFYRYSAEYIAATTMFEKKLAEIAINELLDKYNEGK